MKGTVISVPLPPSSVQLPLSPDQEAPYIIQFIDGTIIQVSPFLMDDIVDCHDSPSPSPLPNWIGHKTKVMYLHDGEYNKGYMIFDQKHCCWRFSSQRRNGVELWGLTYMTWSNHVNNILMMAYFFLVGIRQQSFSKVLLVTFLRSIVKWNAQPHFVSQCNHPTPINIRGLHLIKKNTMGW